MYINWVLYARIALTLQLGQQKKTNNVIDQKSSKITTYYSIRGLGHTCLAKYFFSINTRRAKKPRSMSVQGCPFLDLLFVLYQDLSNSSFRFKIAVMKESLQCTINWIDELFAERIFQLQKGGNGDTCHHPSMLVLQKDPYFLPCRGTLVLWYRVSGLALFP